MHAYTARVMGTFSFQRNDAPVRGLEARKAQELLCFLLVYRQRAHTREALATKLWDDLPRAQARAYLRKALWQVESSIEPSPAAGEERLLIVEPECVRINPAADINLDLAVLEKAAASTQGIPGEALGPSAAGELRHAVELYRGDLLDGWYQDWCIFERERLVNLYLGLLDKLMANCEARGDFEHGLAYGPLILRYDRARELTHQRLMRLHFLAGDRSLALRQYEQCVLALQEELDVAPTPVTSALHASIQANQLPGATASVAAALAASPDSSLPGRLNELRELSHGLGAFCVLLQQRIAALEQSLTKNL